MFTKKYRRSKICSKENCLNENIVITHFINFGHLHFGHLHFGHYISTISIHLKIDLFDKLGYVLVLLFASFSIIDINVSP